MLLVLSDVINYNYKVLIGLLLYLIVRLSKRFSSSSSVVVLTWVKAEPLYPHHK